MLNMRAGGGAKRPRNAPRGEIIPSGVEHVGCSIAKYFKGDSAHGAKYRHGSCSQCFLLPNVAIAAHSAVCCSQWFSVSRSAVCRS